MPVSGTRPCSSAQPMTLSTALCRPMSSRTTSIVPSASNNAAACSPRCCRKPFARPQLTGHRLERGGGDGGGIVAGREAADHPHRVQRRLAADPARGGGVEVAGDIETGRFDARRQRHVQHVVGVASRRHRGRRSSGWSARRSRSPMTPSVSRNPCASSISEPGVRMVTVIGVPLTPDLQRLLDGQGFGAGDRPIGVEVRCPPTRGDVSHQ